MHSTITIRTASGRHVLHERLQALTAGGTFQVCGLEPVGVGTWTFHLATTRPDMVVGFGKVAEFLVVLAREFDVQAVAGRTPWRSIAAAS